MDITEAMQEFIKYAKTYNLKEPRLMEKFHHTFRVVEYAKDIARSEGMEPKDIRLAMLCALLHDIGRFRQYTMYQTFRDEKSVDHGNEASNILRYNNYIKKYTKDPEEQKIILAAVRNHNKYKVEDGLSERQRLFVNITRDADKLDIMKEKGNDILGKFILNPKYIKPFQDKRLYKNAGVTGEYEVTLRTIAFIYDFNFKYAYTFVKENKIIEDKIDLLISHSTSLGIFEYLQKITLEYVDKKIEELS